MIICPSSEYPLSTKGFIDLIKQISQMCHLQEILIEIDE